MATRIAEFEAVVGLRDNVSKETAGLVKNMNGDLGRAMKTAGVGMTVLGGAITGAFAISVKAATDFSRGLGEIATLGGPPIAELKTGILDVAAAFGQDLGAATKATYDIISAGFGDNPLELLELSAKAAVAGVTDVSTAVDLGTSVLNAFGLSADQAGMVFDQAFTAVKAGKTTMDQLAGAVGKVAPLFQAAGIGSDEMFASIAALTVQGIVTKESVSGLKAALANILTPSEKAAKLAKELGLSFNSEALEAEGLAGFLDTVRDATKGDIDMMTTLFGSQEAQVSMFALTGVGAEKYAETLDAMTNSQGATNEAFEAFLEANPAFAFEQLKATMAAVAVEIGENLLPPLIEFARWMITGIGHVRDFIKEHPKWTKAIVLGGAAFGVMTLAAGGLLFVLPNIVTGMALIAKVLGFQGAMSAAGAVSGGAGVAGSATKAAGGFRMMRLGLIGKLGLAGALLAVAVIGGKLIGEFLAQKIATKAAADAQASYSRQVEITLEVMREQNVVFDEATLAGKTGEEQLLLLEDAMNAHIDAREKSTAATKADAFAVKEHTDIEHMSGLEIVQTIRANNAAREEWMKVQEAHRQGVRAIAARNVEEIKLRTAMEQGTEVYRSQQTASQILTGRMTELESAEAKLREELVGTKEEMDLTEEETKQLKAITDAFSPSVNHLTNQIALLSQGYGNQAARLNELGPVLDTTTQQYRDLAASIRDANAAAGGQTATPGGPIGGFGHGTSFAPGGKAILGEGGSLELVAGPMIANLARGATVFNPSETRDILSGGGGGTTIDARTMGNTFIVRSDADIEGIAEAIQRRWSNELRIRSIGRGVVRGGGA